MVGDPVPESEERPVTLLARLAAYGDPLTARQRRRVRRKFWRDCRRKYRQVPAVQVSLPGGCEMRYRDLGYWASKVDIRPDVPLP
jgi:hypothetical protein